MNQSLPLLMNDQEYAHLYALLTSVQQSEQIYYSHKILICQNTN